MWWAMTNHLSGRKHCLHLLVCILSKVNPLVDSEEQLRGIQIDLVELKESMGLRGNGTIRYLKEAIRVIMSTPIDHEDARYWECKHFLSAPRIDKEASVVTVDIDPVFLPYLTGLRKFLELRCRILGASNRAILFYSALKSIHSRNIFKITPEQIQAACGTKYRDFGHFRSKFLDPVIKDLAANGVNIKYKTTLSTRGNCRKIAYLSFTVREPKGFVKVPQIASEEPQVEDVDDHVSSLPASHSASNHKINEVFEYFRTICDKGLHYDLTPKRMNLIGSAIGETPIDLVKACIDAFSRDKWFVDNGKVTVEMLFRSREEFQNRLAEVDKTVRKKQKQVQISNRSIEDVLAAKEKEKVI